MTTLAAVLIFSTAYVLVVLALSRTWRWWREKVEREMAEAQADVRDFAAYRQGLDRLYERGDFPDEPHNCRCTLVDLDVFE